MPPKPTRRLALFTAESAQVGAALEEVFRRFGEQLVLVVGSDVNGGILESAKTVRHLHQKGGTAFLAYMFLGWPLYQAFLPWQRIRKALLRRPPRRVGLAELCRQYDVDHVVTTDINGEDTISEVTAREVDLIISFQCDQIFGDDLIASAREAVVNFHPSYLPMARGPFPVLALGSRPELPRGVSVHQIVDRGIDTGPILARAKIEVDESRSIIYQEHATFCKGVELLSQVLRTPGAAMTRSEQQGDGSYFSYPSRDEIRALHRRGMRLATVSDTAAVYRETFADVA